MYFSIRILIWEISYKNDAYFLLVKENYHQYHFVNFLFLNTSENLGGKPGSHGSKAILLNHT